MRSLNRVQLIGRLGKDPEVNHLGNGATVAKFSLATDESYVNREGVKIDQVEWHNIVMWRRLAEIAEQFLRKGKLVYIEGRLRTRSWEDDSGQKKYMTEIEASNMMMLGGKDSSGGDSQSYMSSQQKTGNVKKEEGDAATPPASDAEVDDLPF